MLRFFFAWLALGVSVLAGCGGSASPTSPTPTSPPLTNVAELLGERHVGVADAPVTIIQYSSLTCPHCSTFHQATWPAIRSAYVDTGKVRMVYRDFPLDSSALSAASLARCAGASKFFDALDILYREQVTWYYAGNQKTSMKGLLAPVGMTSEQMDACLASTELQNGILQIKQEGQSKDGVTAVPTFIINGQKVVGALPFASFDAIIKSYLPQ